MQQLCDPPKRKIEIVIGSEPFSKLEEGEPILPILPILLFLPISLISTVLGEGERSEGKRG